MKEYKENIDYKFILVGESDVHIELLTGKYSGVVYKYGQTSVDEDKETDQAYLSFVYDVVDNKGFELDEDDEFKQHIGDVLVSVISEYANGVLNENRTNNSKESNL